MHLESRSIELGHLGLDGSKQIVDAAGSIAAIPFNASPPLSTRPPKLLDLPPEMIDEIASFLPLHAVACLALCNKALQQVVGERHRKCMGVISAKDRAYKEHIWIEQGKYWIPPRNKERDHLLMLLSRSCGAYYECH
ncbi:uncharacterized protein PAC_06061 [Phialocephala subalpina]|uniref:F-box domain-containing protein n=1 Tax=Phialocephala subalpina TaxID=576137 RepID=A0A1L7WTT2_9HELO|nr:uncharacterized protein PAC_06061 [Phialocephala subalpina]